MYRCQLCAEQVGPNVARRVHQILRQVPAQHAVIRGVEHPQTRTEIAREIPVCPTCAHLLDQGYTLRAVETLVGKRPVTRTLQQMLPELVGRQPVPQGTGHRLRMVKPNSN